jgi:hypothetical protein
MNTEEIVEEYPSGTTSDGMLNFQMYVKQSKETVCRTVFPTGERHRIINPRAKPLKLNPPK